ncbi:MAG TPA: anthrone oxygenase family protein [Methyloceanibacter sp.]|nr:anthrone oxygenase family protein [Methyloceanibacter sp.]
MDRALFVVTLLSALGSGLIGGLFFAFSVFVMTALGRIAPAAGIAAMQSINVAVLNPVFFAAFFGTAVLTALALIAGLSNWPQASARYLVVGGMLYLAGTIAVTMVCNVPLNNKLARVQPESDEGALLWQRYLSDWTAWNHVRTITALAASACFIMALVRLAS